MASAIGIVLIVTLIAWLDLWGPINIKEWQTLIGGVITAAGILVAAWNVTRQMRFTAQLREEDRIEKELPGLIEAGQLLSVLALHFDKNVKAKHALAAIRFFGFPEDGSSFLDEVVKKLPNSADQLRRRLANNLNAIWACATPARVGEEHLREILDSDTPRSQGTLNEGITEMYNMLSTYVGFLHSMNVEVHERIKLYETRRLVCRAGIERFLNG